MPRLALTALLVTALALAGCGGGGSDSAQDFDGAERDVAQVVEDLEEAGQEDEPRRICNALLSRALVQTIEDRGENCEEAVDSALAQTDTFSLDVTSVRITGDRARARVETGVDEKAEEVVELVREGRTWRIAGLPGATS